MEDFVELIMHGFKRLPNGWWFWEIIISLTAGIIIFCVYKRRYKEINKRIIAHKTVLIAYILFILFETVLGRRTLSGSSVDGRYQLVPFWSYIALFNGRKELAGEIVLNYFLFMPLGLMSFFICNQSKMMKLILWGLLFSALIETTQFVFSIGLFEIDDIIGNTIGFVIGIQLGKLIKIILNRKA